MEFTQKQRAALLALANAYLDLSEAGGELLHLVDPVD